MNILLRAKTVSLSHITHLYIDTHCVFIISCLHGGDDRDDEVTEEFNMCVCLFCFWEMMKAGFKTGVTFCSLVVKKHLNKKAKFNIYMKENIYYVAHYFKY